jgi:hypothetical protein
VNQTRNSSIKLTFEFPKKFGGELGGGQTVGFQDWNGAKARIYTVLAAAVGHHITHRRGWVLENVFDKSLLLNNT